MSEQATAQAQQQSMPLYDADAEQVFSYEFSDDEGSYVVTHTYKPLEDDWLIDFDEARKLTMRPSRKGESDLKSQTLGAACWLFDEICDRVEGYGDPEEETPENWKELIDPEEKQTAVSTLLLCDKVVPENNLPRKTRPRWGGNREGRTIYIRAFFSGREVTLGHKLKPKSAKDVEDYDDIRTVIRFGKGKKLGKSDIKIPAQMKAKAELYQRLVLSTEGYKGRVPLHHQAFVVDEYFGVEQEVVSKK